MGTATRIDLNADLGESCAVWSPSADLELLPHLSSANVACGFHAGDPSTMRRTCAAASALDVRVGAHVGYPDRAGFGRRALDVAPDELAADVIYQVGALRACAEAEGTVIAHLKPHGALYNACIADARQATAVADAVAAVDRTLAVLTPPGSALACACIERGLTVVAEAFADRRYEDDGTLVARSDPAALLSTADAIAQALSIATDRRVATRGGWLPLAADSLCVHGDTPGAVALAAGIGAALRTVEIEIRPFA